MRMSASMSGLMFGGLLALSLPLQAATGMQWIGTWSAAPDATSPPLAGQTVRQVIRTSMGGEQVRLRLSNLRGEGPVTLGPVHVAQRGRDASIVAGSDHVVTFGGKTTVVIAKGKEVLSDAVALPVGALQELAVSIHVGDGAGVTTAHGVGLQTAYIAPGDVTGSVDFPMQEHADGRYFLTDVEVSRNAPACAIAVLGDSISDGVGSTADANARWPDVLAAHQQAPGGGQMAVLNEGISGNRVVHDERLPFRGPAALSRLDRDVLAKPGVCTVVLLEGINDISASSYFPGSPDDLSAAQIIDGMKTIAARVHASGKKIIGVTLLPFDGLEWPFHSARGELTRQAVNTWIRNGNAFDGVVDADAALRDPAHPERLQAVYDSGDHLHPNDEGHRAIAAAFSASVPAKRPVTPAVAK